MYKNNSTIQINNKFDKYIFFINRRMFIVPIMLWNEKF